jgi:hypothetical protein
VPGDDDRGPVDPRNVDADDRYVEDFRYGHPGSEPLGRRLAAMRDDMHRVIDVYFDDILGALAAAVAPAGGNPTPVAEPPPLDAQSLAFRENPVPVTDEQIGFLAEAIHLPATSLGPILLPDDWEALRWDAERTGPKTLEEARAALAERIVDPAAPDDGTHAGAYDDLDGEGAR